MFRKYSKLFTNYLQFYKEKDLTQLLNCWFTERKYFLTASPGRGAACAWNSNDLYCYNVKYCLNNGACWPNYPSLLTTKNVYSRTKEKYLGDLTWLPTLLPLDSCLACHKEPTILSKLLLVGSPGTTPTPPRTPWKNMKLELWIVK